MDEPICTRCAEPIFAGEERHLTVQPFHPQCSEHRRCYVQCWGDHPREDLPTGMLFALLDNGVNARPDRLRAWRGSQTSALA